MIALSRTLMNCFGSLQGDVVSYFCFLSSLLYYNIFCWWWHRDPEMTYFFSLEEKIDEHIDEQRKNKWCPYILLWKSMRGRFLFSCAFIGEDSLNPCHLTWVEGLLNNSFCCHTLLTGVFTSKCLVSALLFMAMSFLLLIHLILYEDEPFVCWKKKKKMWPIRCELSNCVDIKCLLLWETVPKNVSPSKHWRSWCAFTQWRDQRLISCWAISQSKPYSITVCTLGLIILLDTRNREKPRQ